MKSQTLYFALSAAFAPYTTWAACCYTSTPQFVTTNNFNLKIRAVTDTSATPNAINLDFPADYQVSAWSNGTSTAACPVMASSMSCTSSAADFQLFFKLLTPANPNGNPTSTLSVNGESCSLQQWCSAFDGVGGAAVTDPDSGLINLGPLGKWSPTVFGIVLGAIILTFVGVGFLAYRRNSTSSSIGDPETAMAYSANRPGWFGELDRPAVDTTRNTPVGSVPAKLKETSKGDGGRRKSSSHKNGPKSTSSRRNDDDRPLAVIAAGKNESSSSSSPEQEPKRSSRHVSKQDSSDSEEESPKRRSSQDKRSSSNRRSASARRSKPRGERRKKVLKPLVEL